VKVRRVAVGWLGTPISLTLLWVAAEMFAEEMPGTALIVGLLGLVGVVVCIGLFFYILRE